MSSEPFKRQELNSRYLKFCFFFFIFFSIFMVSFFVLEDYRYSMNFEKTLDSSATPSFSPFTDTTEGLFRHKAMALENPWGVALIVAWVLFAILFALVFNPRLHAMFKVFFWISLGVVIIFNFWTFLVSFALEHPDKEWVGLLSHIQTSLTSKTLLLLSWGFFSVYFSFVVATTKYLGLFARLNYLFQSIQRGNWDSIMFFRTEDSFHFLAKTFNQLKQSYLDQLFEMEEQLILVKDSLVAETPLKDLKKKLMLSAEQKMPSSYEKEKNLQKEA